MDAGGPSFTTHQQQHSHYPSSYYSTCPSSHSTGKELPNPDADDHDLPPGLDPDFQDPFPPSPGAYSARKPHYQNIDGHKPHENQEESEQEEEQPIVASSARTRTHLLPPAFSSDEDENESESEDESGDNQDEKLEQNRLRDEQSPEKREYSHRRASAGELRSHCVRRSRSHHTARSSVKRLKIVLKPRRQPPDTAESDSKEQNAMVSTRGARPTVDYSEAPVEDDDHPNGTGAAEGRRASGSGLRSTRHSTRRGGQGVQENGGHESDVSILKKGRRAAAACASRKGMGQGTAAIQTRGRRRQESIQEREHEEKKDGKRPQTTGCKETESAMPIAAASQSMQATLQEDEMHQNEFQTSKPPAKARSRLRIDQSDMIHEGLSTPPLSARPSPLVEVSLGVARAQRSRGGRGASLTQIDASQSTPLIHPKPAPTFDNQSMSSLTESLSEAEPSPSRASCYPEQDPDEDDLSDGACVESSSSPVRQQHISTSSAFLHLLRLLFVPLLNLTSTLRLSGRG